MSDANDHVRKILRFSFMLRLAETDASSAAVYHVALAEWRKAVDDALDSVEKLEDAMDKSRMS